MLTRQEWDKAMTLRAQAANFGFSLPFSKPTPAPQKIMGIMSKGTSAAIDRVGDLLDLYHGVNPTVKEDKEIVLGHLYLEGHYIAKHFDKPQKLGRILTSQQRDVVRQRIWIEAQNEMTRMIASEVGNTGITFEKAFEAIFARSVNEICAAMDNQAVAHRSLMWLDESKRRRYKLSFRDGIAYRKVRKSFGRKELIPFDNEKLNQIDKERSGADSDLWTAEDQGTTPFVMDLDGRIYGVPRGTRNPKNPTQITEFKHSSVLEGAATLAAGTFRFKDGRLQIVTSKSGHYQPSLLQMLNFFERLRSYRVDISKVIFLRWNESDDWFKTDRSAFNWAPFTAILSTLNATDSGTRQLEPCFASDLLNKRKFPGKVPDSVYVERS